jgi:hypothetical protein
VKQKPPHVYHGKYGRDGRERHEVSFTAVDHPLTLEKPSRGHKPGDKVLGRTVQCCSSHEEAEGLCARIRQEYFPTKEGALDVITREKAHNFKTSITNRSLTTAMRFLDALHEKYKDVEVINMEKLVEKLTKFVEIRGFDPTRASSPRWNDAMKAWIRVVAEGDDVENRWTRKHRIASNPLLLERLTNHIFEGMNVDEVDPELFNNFLIGRAKLPDVTLPEYAPDEVVEGKVTHGKLVKPGVFKYRSTTGRLGQKNGRKKVKVGALVDYEGEYPFTFWTAQKLQTQFQSFKNWCAKSPRKWCTMVLRETGFTYLRVPEPVRAAICRDCVPIEAHAITMEWFFFAGWHRQRPVPGDATYAAFAWTQSYGGFRKWETRTGAAEDLQDYQASLQDWQGKVGSRVNVGLPIFLLGYRYLSLRGRWKKKNLSPDDRAIKVILYLAGWEIESERIKKTGDRFIAYCKKHNIAMPPRGNFGPFPHNGFRTLALTMHFKLFLEDYSTGIWGGTSKGMLDDWYKAANDLNKVRLTSAHGLKYWLDLPEPIRNWMKGNDRSDKTQTFYNLWGKEHNGRIVGLPRGHKLLGHLEPEEKVIIDGIDEAPLHNEVMIAAYRKKLELAKVDLAAEVENRELWLKLNPGEAIQHYPGDRQIHIVRSRLFYLQLKIDQLMGIPARADRTVSGYMSRLAAAKEEEEAEIAARDAWLTLNPASKAGDYPNFRQLNIIRGRRQYAEDKLEELSGKPVKLRRNFVDGRNDAHNQAMLNASLGVSPPSGETTPQR